VELLVFCGLCFRSVPYYIKPVYQYGIWCRYGWLAAEYVEKHENNKKMKQVSEVLRSGSATVVDVRTPAEFMGGNVAGSINIPLNEVPAMLSELKGMGTVVVCCASGMRSASAASFLKANGIDCYDGGPWTQVNYYVNNN